MFFLLRSFHFKTKLDGSNHTIQKWVWLGATRGDVICAISNCVNAFLKVSRKAPFHVQLWCKEGTSECTVQPWIGTWGIGLLILCPPTAVKILTGDCVTASSTEEGISPVSSIRCYTPAQEQGIGTWLSCSILCPTLLSPVQHEASHPQCMHA